MGSLSYIKDLSKEIANEITSLAGVNIYPDTLGFPTPPTDYNDIYSGGKPNKDFSSSLGYGFKVIGDKEQWKEFRLQINPQEFQQDEEFAIQFFPTPTGIVVEHQGSIMKDIVISGTTGIHPKRGMGGIDLKGDVIFGKGDSGYKQFHDLRNYIRSYIERKKKPEYKDLQLLFYNFKDKEYFIVEPTRFSLKRSSTRPFLYDYSIVLKTLDRTLYKEIIDENTFDKIINTTGEILDRVNNGLKVANGVLKGGINLLISIEKTVESTIIGPINQVSQMIDDYRAGKTAVLKAYRGMIKNIKAAVDNLANKFADKTGAGSQDYNDFMNIPTTTDAIDGISSGREPTDEEWKVLNALMGIRRGLDVIIFTNDYYEQSNDDEQTEIEDVYKKTNEVNNSILDGEDPTNTVITPQKDFSLPKANSTQSKQILDGDTVQKIASRELGDGSRFREIIILNKLVYPYIASNAEIEQIRIQQGLPVGKKPSGILSYDDKVLIPSQIAEREQFKGVYTNVDYEITKNVSQVEKNMGVDIRINREKDIAITNTHDTDLIAGVQTVVQAIGVRLGVEKGGYELHTQYGVSLNIGEKNTLGAILIKDQIEQQLAQDERLSPSTKVDVIIEGNIIYVNIYAKLKTNGQIVPLQLVAQE